MAGPLSVEDILAKQKAEKEAAAKPKFLSKAERAKIALEKRNAEVKTQQQREDEEKASRIEFEKRAEEERRRSEESRYGGGGGRGGDYGRGGGYGRDGRGGGFGRDDYRGRNDRYSHDQQERNGHPPTGPRGAPTGPRGYNNGPIHPPSTSSPLARDIGHLAGPSSSVSQSPAPSSPKPNVPGDAAQPSDYELAVIKSRYLGGKDFNKKPRLRKEQNSKKMNFDWNAADDTTAHEQGSWRTEVRANAPGAVMLGGRLAGYDEGGQRRGQNAVEDK